MIALLTLVAPSLAASWTVDASGGADFDTLSAAVAGSSSGDDLTVAPGTYSDECIDLAGKDLSIEAADPSSPPLVLGSSACDNLLVIVQGETVAISGLHLQATERRVVWLSGGATLSLEDVSIEGSGNWNSWAGTIYVDGSTLELTDSTMSGNTGSYGGAIYAQGLSTVTIEGSTLSGNSGWYGAAIYLQGGTALHVQDSVFEGNWTYYSGAIHAYSGNAVAISSSRFASNTLYSGNGGALYLSWDSSLALQDSEFVGNQASGSGGAIMAYANNVAMDIEDCDFEDNVASAGSGGAIHVEWYPDLRVVGSRFVGNEAGVSGGAITTWYDTELQLEGSTFEENIASTGVGGAVAFYDGDQSHGMTVANSVFHANAAASDGGAIDATWVSSLTVSESSFTFNTAGPTALGGAIDLYVANDVLVHGNRFCGNEGGTGGALSQQWVYLSDVWTNNVFQENIGGDGGAAWRYQAYVGQTVNNTFLGNRATRYGGAYYAYYAYTDWRNNIVAHTASGSGLYAVDPYSGTHSTLAYDDWTDNAATDGGGYFQVGWEDDGHLALDPAFMAWTRNGDCTDDDLRLSWGSGLLDMGDPDILDADGSRSDIGAYGGPGAEDTDLDGDGFGSATDCDDDNDAVHPEATEVCDGLDNDCSGVVDGADASDASTWAADGDGDGYGDPDALTTSCGEAPEGHVVDATDCDDTDPAVYPGAPETQGDGVDQDCDGADAEPPAEVEEEETQEAGGCGCITPAAPVGLGWLAGLALLGLRRRRA